MIAPALPRDGRVAQAARPDAVAGWLAARPGLAASWQVLADGRAYLAVAPSDAELLAAARDMALLAPVPTAE